MNWLGLRPCAFEWLWALLCAVAIVSAPSGARARTITVTRVTPGKVAGAAVLRRIATVPFRGAEGAEVASALQNELSSVQLGGKSYFVVSASASEAGARSSGIDATLRGESQVQLSETPFKGLGFGCTAADSSGNCIRLGVTFPDCIKRELQLTVFVNLVRWPDGTVVYSAQKMGKGSLSWCAGQSPPTSNEVAFSAALKPIVADVRRDLSPSEQRLKITFKDGDRGLPKDQKDALRADLKNMDDLSAACSGLRQINAAVPNDASVTFDLGACAEAADNLEEALQDYQRAQSMNASDREATTALSRVEAALAAKAEQARAEEALRAARAAEQQRLAHEEAEAQAAEARDSAARRRASASAKERARLSAAAKKAAELARMKDATAKYGAAMAPVVMQGRVVKGMTAQQVLGAKGPPTRKEEIEKGTAQWYYPGLRVIFTSGRVSYVGS